MRKTLVKSMVLILAAAFVMSCSSSHHEFGEWTEMDEFHEVLAVTWHPLVDEGDPQPMYDNAEELAASADAWAKSDIPAEHDNSEIKEKLFDLSKTAQYYAEAVKENVAEEDIREMLSNVHDKFHTLNTIITGEQHGEEGHEEGGHGEEEHHDDDSDHEEEHGEGEEEDENAG